MSYTEANIVPLEDEDKNLVYPPTVYQAVFNPETGGTLDQEMITSAEEESITDTIPRDADTLGGHTPDYFATNDSLNAKVKYATYTATVDVSANGYVIALTYPTLSGYIAIGITNSISGSNSTYAIPVNLDSRRVAIRNVSASALTSITLYTTVTYLKV